MKMTDEELLEKFGVVDEETGELVVDREALKRNIVERGVNILKEIDVLKERTTDLIVEADEYGFDKAHLRAVIKYMHSQSLQSEIQKLQDLDDAINQLFADE